MIPTPDLSHLTAADYELVYEPAGHNSLPFRLANSSYVVSRLCSEDTFILLDGLEKEADTLRGLKPRVCLEIGSVNDCSSAGCLRLYRATSEFSRTVLAL